jgi:general secretion pathway protein N
MARLKPLAPSPSPWGWAAGGALLGLTVALLVFAPARWLTDTVQQISAGRLVLAQARGTVWNGSAQLLLAGGLGSSDAVALPGRVAWQLRPAWGAWHASLEASCCTPLPLQLQAVPRWGGMQLTLDDGQSQWPAALLAGLGTPWNTIQAEGVLSLSTRGLSMTLVQGRLAIAGQAQLEALGLSSRLSTLRPMGSYRLTLQGGDTATLELATLEGSLQLTGSGRWVGSRLHFEGAASAQAERVDALSNLLNIIGQRDGARSIIKVG